MPIKWKSFGESEKYFNMPEIPNEGNWTPFVPNFRAEEPLIDIYQDKINLYIEISLTGINPKDIKVSIENNILTIKGKTEERKEIKEQDYLRKEIRRGSFERSIKLPVEVKEKDAKAESIGNVLKVVVPKVVKLISKGKEIPIKVK